MKLFHKLLTGSPSMHGDEPSKKRWLLMGIGGTMAFTGLFGFQSPESSALGHTGDAPALQQPHGTQDRISPAPAIGTPPGQSNRIVRLALPTPSVRTTAPPEPQTSLPSVAPAKPSTTDIPAPRKTSEPVDGMRARTTAGWKKIRIRSGDSLAKVFKREGLSPGDLHRVVHINADTKKLTRLHPGDHIHIDKDGEGHLTGLMFDLDETHRLWISRNGENQLVAETELRPYDTITNQASAVIDDSLFVAAQKAGLSDSLTMELANIFGWDVDFARDIRSGDRFSVVYEELYRDGEKARDGAIIAAEFVNQGKTYRAVRFTDPSGRTDYYAPDGKSIRKAFLRSPVKFSRISSRFSFKRKHPILGYTRAHRGVDYAAPTGTAIRATADGKVIYRGRKGGYGRTVIIRHSSGYTSLYAHMSRYARKARKGRRVKQGDIIGYVGMSGTATGPHLHYELRVNGVHRNPLRVRLPSAAPLPAKYKDLFKQATAPLLARLDVLGSTHLAMKEPAQ